MKANKIQRRLFPLLFTAILISESTLADEVKLVTKPPVITQTGNTCPNLAPAAPLSAPNPNYQRKYDTLAHRFLDEEKSVGPVTPSMYALLDVLIDEARASLPKYPDKMPPGQAGELAKQALTGIDCILLRHGFVYPGHGAVQLLSDGLSPLLYSNADELAELKNQAYNIRRAAFINTRGKGPFYVADCDIGSYLFLAIAEVMGYPLHLIDIPNHNFVRWELGGGKYINYETMDGFVTDDRYYRQNWQIPDKFANKGGTFRAMNAAETMAYHDASLAIAWSWRHNYEKMVEYYRRSIALDPGRALSLNNLAWYYAIAPNPQQRNGAEAIKYAKKAADLLPTSDEFDTLACAYAQAGDFKRALAMEKKAVSINYSPYSSDIASHIDLFKQKKPCDDPTFDSDPNPFRAHQESAMVN